MLHFVRRHARSWVVWIFVAIIIGVFTFWGVSAVVEGPSSQSVVAMVGERPIERLELQRAEMNLVEAYRNMYKERFTPEVKASLNLRQQALDGLIDRMVLIDRARELGLGISDQQLLDAILDNPSFQREGRFDKELYLRVLRYARQTPADYESGCRDDLLVQQLQGLITDGVSVSDEEIREDIVGQGERTKVAFVKFKASDETTKFDVTDDDLKAYFEKNKSRYAEPERIRIEFVSYPTDRFQEGIAIDDAAITEYYEANKEQSFQQPFEVRARHILRRVDEKADEAMKKAARDLLEGLRKRIVDEGADFAKLAQENSEDTGSKDAGGELGFFAKGRMVEPFEKAAFALKPGETSQVVETPYGFHLIQVEEIHEARVKPLEEVRGEIEEKLRNEKARAAAGEAAKADHEAAAKGGDFAAVATRAGSRSRSRSAAANAPSRARESMLFSNALWSACTRRDPRADGGERDWVLARVVEPAGRDPVLRAGEGAPRDQSPPRQGTELARKQAEELSPRPGSRLAQGGRRGGAARVVGVGRDRPERTPRPRDPAAATTKLAIARLTDDKKLADQVFVVAGDAVIVELMKRTVPSDEEIAKKMDETRKTLLERKQQEVFATYVDEQKQKGEVKVFPDRLEQLPKA
jgi:peptidyl-prolyl cis-trans isomerase D